LNYYYYYFTYLLNVVAVDLTKEKKIEKQKNVPSNYGASLYSHINYDCSIFFWHHQKEPY